MAHPGIPVMRSADRVEYAETVGSTMISAFASAKPVEVLVEMKLVPCAESSTSDKACPRHNSEVRVFPEQPAHEMT